MTEIVIEVSVPQTADVEALADTVDVVADPTGAQVIVVATPGPPGPSGPPGSGGITHIQSAPAATWTITNTLGRYPASVMVMVGTVEVFADVEIPDTTTIVITFASPVSGRAEII